MRTERDDIHDVFNHDLSIPLPEECKAEGDKLIAYQYHIINLRPKAEHASASKFSSIKQMLKSASVNIDVDKDFYPYRRETTGTFSNLAILEKERQMTKGERVKTVRSEARETNKNEVVFESFPSKREIKQIKKEFKKQRKEYLESGKMGPQNNPDGFDELDQFFQRLSKSENRKQDQKIAQELGIPYGAEKLPPKLKPQTGRMKGGPIKRKSGANHESVHRQQQSLPSPQKRGFDFEKEFRETGELQQWEAKLRQSAALPMSTSESAIGMNSDYLYKLTAPKTGQSIGQQAADENTQRQYMAQRKRAKTLGREQRDSKNCPFVITLPKQRPKAVKMKEGIEMFPFQYAFQQNRMRKELRQSIFDWSIIWPVQSKSRNDNKRGYIFNDEESYYQEYGQSIFAYTYRKGGWESMRHYEIMCNGAIPYFIDIDKMPPHTMTR